MKRSFVLVFIFFGLHSVAQKYVAIYSVQMLPIVEDLSLDSAENIKDVPQWLLKELAGNIAGKGLRYQKHVIAGRDSTTIQIVTEPGSPLRFGCTNYLLLKNGLFEINAENSSLIKDTIEYRNLAFTGNKKMIGNYNCREMSDETGNLHIWVTKELPTLLNPAINVCTGGAILEYSIRSKMSVVVGQLISIRLM